MVPKRYPLVLSRPVRRYRFNETTVAVSKHGLIDSRYLRRPHFDSRSLAAAVVRGTLVIPSEHCRPRDFRDSFGTLSSEGLS